MWAADKKHAAVVQALLAFQPQDGQPGIDVNARDSDNSSALDLAIRGGDLQIIQVLQGAVRIKLDNKKPEKLYTDEKECIICVEPYDNEKHIRYAYFPCGHNVCSSCSKGVSDTGGKCPNCRKDIESFYRVKDSDIKKGGKTRKLRCKFKCGRRTKHKRKYNKAKRRKSKKNLQK
jgi:hypothetical protein